LLRRATAVVTAALLLIIAINTSVSAGDASSAERAIESYAKAGMWMLAILGVALSLYAITDSGD
jgi:hypothetical protein